LLEGCLDPLDLDETLGDWMEDWLCCFLGEEVLGERVCERLSLDSSGFLQGEFI